jgi:hypothetical protein
MAIDLLDYITTTIRFYMESGIARLQTYSHNNVFVKFFILKNIIIVMPLVT